MPVAAPREARLALVAVVAAAGVFLLVSVRGFYFGGDDWFVVTDRGLTPGPGREGLFEPHYEHWATLPIIAFRGLFAVFGIRTYWPYIGLTIAVHLSVVVLIWVIMLRARTDVWVATAVCAVFAVAGTGFENVTNAWQTQLIAPLAFGLGALLLAPEAGNRMTARDAGASLLLVAAVMCSGVALPMLVSFGVVAVVRRGWRVALTTVAAPAALYVWWYLAYGRHGQRVADPAPGRIPRFVWDGLTDAIGDVARVELVGAVVVLAAVAWLTVRLLRRAVADLVVPGALALGGVVFLAATGYRRGALLGADPALSRYAYVTLTFVLPLLAMAGQCLFRGGAGRRAALVVLTLVLVVAQANVLDHQANLARPGKQSDRGAVLATATLAREGRRFLLERPLSAFEPQVTVDEIVAMDRDGKLPPLSGAAPTDFLTVLARLDVFVGPEPLLADAAVARVASTRRSALSTDSDGCVRIRARPGNEIVLRVDGPGTFRVRGDGLLGFRLRDPESATEGEVVHAMLDRAETRVVSVATSGSVLVLALPPRGPTRLCGLLQ